MNIYKLFKYTLAAAAMLLIASCDDEQGFKPHNGQVEARFTTNLTQGWATRVAGNSWETDDKVGIVAIPDGEEYIPDGTIFRQYKVSVAGSAATLVAISEDETIYYSADDNDKVNFIAFYPYQELEGDNGFYVKYALPTDQSTKEKMGEFDVLYHKGTTAYNGSNPVVDLDFEHKMSKLTLNFKTLAATSGAYLDPSGATKVQIGILPAVTWLNLDDGSMFLSEKQTTTNMYVSSDAVAHTATAQAVIAPHKANHTTYKDRTISITVGEKTHNYTLPNDRAFESGKSYTFNFELTTNGLRMVGESVEDWLEGTTSWNGEYAITLSEDKLTFEKDAVEEYALSFKTNYTGNDVTLKLSESATDANAGVTGNWISEKTALAPTPTSGYTAYSYAFSLTENYGAIRTAYIHITAGTLKQVVKVTQQGLPNSYMVKPGEFVELHVGRANAFTQSIGVADVIAEGGVFTSKVLWSDAQDLVTLSNEGTGPTGKIKVTAAVGKAGNAIVAAMAGSDIVWTWHIWVTDYAPNPATDKWMDRNLGAINNTPGANGSTGLYYQWGRKDPFPGSASATSKAEPTLYNSIGTSFTYAMNESEVTELGVPTLITQQQDIPWTVKNPLTFIGFDGSWMSNSTANYTNWNSTDNQKTLFDPCPEGYRVPQDGSWGADADWKNFTWDGTNKGRDTDSTYGGWYPAAGSRNGNNGAIGNVGSSGFYWPSANSGTYGRYLYFYASAVSTRLAVNRSYGYSVRCVSSQN